ncbi:MAG: hypothetical protein WCK90_02315, partial [archaeon]
MKLKVMEYNILDGFCRRDILGRHTFKPNRMEAGVKLVRGFNPDILVICEATVGAPHFKLFSQAKGADDLYSQMFGFPYGFHGAKKVRISSGFEMKFGSAVLSKFPIEGEDFSMDRIGFLRTSINVEGKEVMVDAYHPHP